MSTHSASEAFLLTRSLVDFVAIKDGRQHFHIADIWRVGGIGARLPVQGDGTPGKNAVAACCSAGFNAANSLQWAELTA